MRLLTLAVALSSILLAASVGPAVAGSPHHGHRPGHGHDDTVRFATFNASLNRAAAGELVDDLSTRDDTQAAAVAEVIQRMDADVLLINEFDYSPKAVELFRRNYLEVAQHGATPVRYPYAFTAPVNTGVPSGFDLNNDGTVGGGDDAFGFGLFPGQYGMVVLSKYPIDTREIRAFQKFRWKDMPGAMLPDDPSTPTKADWYSADELNVFRLSSKSHWDLPIRTGRHSTTHFLVSHPTPPTFDGPEDRNGTRNHDEIRFWADYVNPRASRYVYDDRGHRGGLTPGARFVIAGDQNSDPVDGDSVPGAIQQLIQNPRFVDPKPQSKGAAEAARLQGGANTTQQGDPRYDTADFADTQPGNLRADYVLPSRGTRVKGSGVFWPVQADPLFRLTGVFPFPTSDHRAVWLDVATH